MCNIYIKKTAKLQQQNTFFQHGVILSCNQKSPLLSYPNSTRGFSFSRMDAKIWQSEITHLRNSLYFPSTRVFYTRVLAKKCHSIPISNSYNRNSFYCSQLCHFLCLGKIPLCSCSRSFLMIFLSSSNFKSVLRVYFQNKEELLTV